MRQNLLPQDLADGVKYGRRLIHSGLWSLYYALRMAGWYIKIGENLARLIAAYMFKPQMPPS
jgi:hypothetical protein